MEVVKIDSIRKNPENPRIIRDDKFKKLVKSLNEFPEMMNIRPVVVNKAGVILGGNMRYEAAKVAGWQEIPVEVVELSPEKEREFVIKDNVSGGEWDFDALANGWGVEELTDWGVDVPDGGLGEVDNPFSDTGIDPQQKYGVIIECESAGNQESVFNDLTGMGYKCKILVV
jgi:hypothetical protein